MLKCLSVIIAATFLLTACDEGQMIVVKPANLNEITFDSTIPEPDASVAEVEWDGSKTYSST